MRKLFLFVLSSLVLIGSFAFTYDLTSKDEILIGKFTEKVESMIRKNGETYRGKFVKILSKYSLLYRNSKPRYSAIFLGIANNLKNTLSTDQGKDATNPTETENRGDPDMLIQSITIVDDDEGRPTLSIEVKNVGEGVGYVDSSKFTEHSVPFRISCTDRDNPYTQSELFYKKMFGEYSVLPQEVITINTDWLESASMLNKDKETSVGCSLRWNQKEGGEGKLNNSYVFTLSDIMESEVNITEDLGGCYMRDGNDIYCGQTRVTNADADSFISIGTKRNYGKDINRVFNGDREIIGADPESFTFITNDEYFSKDASKIFYFTDYLEWADVNSFEVVNKYYVRDAQEVRKNSAKYNWPKLDIDITTFDFINIGGYITFAKDKNSLFDYKGDKIADIDGESFEISPIKEGSKTYLAKDKNHIYLLSGSPIDTVTILEGATPATFEYSKTIGNGIFYQDGNKEYRCEKVSSYFISKCNIINQ